MTDVPVYNATPWKGMFDAEITVEVNPGRPIVIRRLSLVEELAIGRVPNELLQMVLFESFVPPDHKLNEAGEIVRKSDPELSVEQRQAWENYLRICARSMVRPRLRLVGTPNYEKGEIAPRDLSYIEVYEIAFRAVKEVLPPLEAAPFPAASNDAGGAEGAVGPGTAPQESPERSAGTDLAGDD